MVKVKGTQGMTVIKHRSKYILVQDCCYGEKKNAVRKAIKIER